jgi:predicted small lipoprotein YifL
MLNARVSLSLVPCILLALAMAFGLSACGRSAPDAPPSPAHEHDHDHDHDHDHHDHDHHHHHHHHEAPRGGTLVELGDHVAHIEFLLDEETGLLRAYILDGHAENPVQLADAAILLEVMPGDGVESFTLPLEAQANPLTGETPGATSEFAGQSDALIGLTQFEAALPAITVRGVTIDAFSFPFPEGNE